jgi:hypothetical protein
MVSVMRVDVAPLKHFLVMAAVGVAVIVLAIIMGVAGMHCEETLIRKTRGYAWPVQVHFSY